MRSVKRARWMGMVVVLVGGLGGAYLWLPGEVNGPSAYAQQTVLPPIDDNTLTTILRGLEARDGAITNIEGFAKFVTLYSQERLDEEEQYLESIGLPPKVSRRALTVGAPSEGMSNKDLKVVRFLMDPERDRWRIEATEVLGSIEDWTINTITSALQIWPKGSWEEEELPILTPHILPTALFVCDGQVHSIHQLHLGVGRKDRFEPIDYRRWPPIRRVLEHLGLVVNKEKVAEWVEKRFSDRDQVKISIEELEGEPCYKLVARTWRKVKPIQLGIWVAPYKGYALLRVEFFSILAENPRLGYRHVWVFRSFQQAGEDIWLPTTSSWHRYNYSPDRQQPWSQTVQATFTRLRANQPLDENLFSYRFPLGTLVSTQEGIEPEPDVISPKRMVETTPFTLERLPEDDQFRQPLTGNEFQDLKK